MIKDELKQKLNRLLEEDPDKETLKEIFNVKLALNLEADKEEVYWEQ